LAVCYSRDVNIRPHSEVVAALVNPPMGPVGDFTVIDVGASGGIAYYWQAFGDSLSAIGFDPLVNNMKKMAAAESRPKVRYEAAFVGCRDFDTLFPIEQRQVRVDPYVRSSSVRAQELMRLNFVAEHFNEGEELIWSDRHVTLDEFLPDGGDLDFLKIDTDGSDLQVLIGADRLLRSGSFLGIMIEAQFQGWPHDYANTFANIDRYLRARGFQLYDVDRNRYTRGALPGHFELNIPAQTLTGQVHWGDALYFRDLAHSHYEATWSYKVTRPRLLKLVALLDLHALPDCAAELLLARPDLTSEAERTRLLDLLVRSAGFDTTFAEHNRRFEQQLQSFYPSAYQPPTQPAPAPPPAPGSASDMPRRSRVDRLKRLLGV
jgi:FkbM family methyltransferase